MQNRANVDERRALRVALVGHAVEWYEFAIFGVLAPYIARAMFPADDPTISLLLTWTAYATAFVVRPLGGIVLSHLADQAGRKRVLLFTVLMMSVATAGLGLVPPHAAIGILAPVIVIGLRLIQGFAVGGEMSSAVPYLLEHVESDRRPRFAGYLAAATFTASLCGAVIATALSHALPVEAMESWGWRLPFLLAAPLGAVALWLRHSAEESPEHVAHRSEAAAKQTPFLVVWRTQKRAVLRFCALATAFNVALAAALTNNTSELILAGAEPADTVAVVVVAYSALVASILIAGRFARRSGWRMRRMAVAGLAGCALLIVPMWWIASSGEVLLAASATALFMIAVGVLATPVYVGLVDSFPVSVRASAGAVAFNLATAVGAFVPTFCLVARVELGWDSAVLACVWVSTCLAAALPVRPAAPAS